MLHFWMCNILKFTQKSFVVLIPYLLTYSQQYFYFVRTLLCHIVLICNVFCFNGFNQTVIILRYSAHINPRQTIKAIDLGVEGNALYPVVSGLFCGQPFMFFCVFSLVCVEFGCQCKCSWLPRKTWPAVSALIQALLHWLVEAWLCDLRKYSFCNRITNVWNSLPEDKCYYSHS